MKSNFLNAIFQRIGKSTPGLKLKLKQAGMEDKSEEFIKKTFLSAFYMTTGAVIFISGACKIGIAQRGIISDCPFNFCCNVFLHDKAA